MNYDSLDLRQVATTPEGLTFPKTEVVLRNIPASEEHPGMLVRLAGDRYVMVEYGPLELDLNLRVRVWALEKHLKEQQARESFVQVKEWFILPGSYNSGLRLCCAGLPHPVSALEKKLEQQKVRKCFVHLRA